MSNKFSISGKQSKLSRYISAAHSFTNPKPIAIMYQRCILFDARLGGLTLTAESEYNAIEVNVPLNDGIEILEEGRVMILSSWIMTSLNVMNPDHLVTIEYDSESNRLTMTAESEGEIHQRVELNIPPIGDKMNTPSLGNPNEDNGISFDPEKFIDSYRFVSASAVPQGEGKNPILRGVLAEPSVDDGLIRLMATDKISSSIDAVKIDSFGDGLQPFLFHLPSMQLAINYFREGNEIKMYSDDSNSLYFHVIGKGNVVPYSIRCGTLEIDWKKFPSASLRKSMSKIIDEVDMVFTADKAELQRVLSNAATIGSLDSSANGGQAKIVLIDIKDGELTASVDSSASYDESLDLDSRVFSSDNSFKFRQGSYGWMLGVYNFEANPAKINIGVSTNAEGKAICIILFKDSLYLDGKVDSVSGGDDPIAETMNIIGVMPA